MTCAWCTAPCCLSIGIGVPFCADCHKVYSAFTPEERERIY